MASMCGTPKAGWSIGPTKIRKGGTWQVGLSTMVGLTSDARRVSLRSQLEVEPANIKRFSRRVQFAFRFPLSSAPRTLAKLRDLCWGLRPRLYAVACFAAGRRRHTKRILNRISTMSQHLRRAQRAKPLYNAGFRT